MKKPKQTTNDFVIYCLGLFGLKNGLWDSRHYLMQKYSEEWKERQLLGNKVNER